MGTIAGVVGQIRWGYYTAAAINGYRVVHRRPPGAAPGTPGRGTLEGQIVASDAFKLAQRPLTFRAPFDGGAWTWPIEEIRIADGRVTARLGAGRTE